MAADRREFEEQFACSDPDLIVLDVMLPDGSGLDICRDLQGRRPLRRHSPDSAQGGCRPDRWAGNWRRRLSWQTLQSARTDGADQGRAAPRSTSGSTSRLIHRLWFSDFTADPEQRSVIHASGERIELTGAEFDLLKVFLDRPGRLLSRDQLLDLTQGKDRGPFDRSVDVLMSRLRKKLETDARAPIFKTVRNGGYQMTVQVRTLPVHR